MNLDDNRKALVELANYKMPFGKFKDRYLIDVPEYYYTWYRQKGFPEGKLGRMMQQMHEIKINGLEEFIYNIRKEFKRK
ncbi:DUF3820 family protein [Winogradskyella aurantia]|uniref:Cytoplasmic protein n=1 Tax=Winogradskyella aurantia TaxID=1915063 RepID=A0A265UQG8_9FLAO|nr:DUF3820 family protein [Winogradskyella aurantia]OZV67545.1 hypothetical protein CA834_11375 [Winogradskyella aurantia]